MVVYLVDQPGHRVAMNRVRRRQPHAGAGCGATVTDDRATGPARFDAPDVSRSRTNAIATAGIRSRAGLAALRRFLDVGRSPTRSGRCPTEAGSAVCRAARGPGRVLGGRQRAIPLHPAGRLSVATSSGGRRWPACCSSRSTPRVPFARGGGPGCSASGRRSRRRPCCCSAAACCGLADSAHATCGADCR